MYFAPNLLSHLEIYLAANLPISNAASPKAKYLNVRTIPMRGYDLGLRGLAVLLGGCEGDQGPGARPAPGHLHVPGGAGGGSVLCSDLVLAKILKAARQFVFADKRHMLTMLKCSFSIVS